MVFRLQISPKKNLFIEQCDNTNGILRPITCWQLVPGLDFHIRRGLLLLPFTIATGFLLFYLAIHFGTHAPGDRPSTLFYTGVSFLFGLTSATLLSHHRTLVLHPVPNPNLKPARKVTVRRIPQGFLLADAFTREPLATFTSTPTGFSISKTETDPELLSITSPAQPGVPIPLTHNNTPIAHLHKHATPPHLTTTIGPLPPDFDLTLFPTLLAFYTIPSDFFSLKPRRSSKP